MNSLIEFLVKQIEEKRLSEQNAVENEIRQKQLDQQLKQIENENLATRATHDLAVAGLKEKFRQDYLGNVKEGTVETEGPGPGLPSRPEYQQGNLPTPINQPVPQGLQNLPPEVLTALQKPVQYQDVDTSMVPGESIPFKDQIIDTPLGPQLVKNVVSYDKQRVRAVDDLKLKQIIEAQGEGMKANAKLPVDLQVEGVKAANAQNLALINQEAADARAKALQANQRDIANARNATTLASAALRAKGTKLADDATLQTTVDAVALGEVKLPAGNNSVPVLAGLKAAGYVNPNVINVQKVPLTTSMLTIHERIKSDIIPKLAKATLDAKSRGLLSKVWPTELANEMAKIELDATTMAREAGEKGNFSNTDIGRALHALTDPGITQEQALSRLKTLKDKIYAKLQNEYLGGLPEKQKIIILQKYNYDPTTILTVNSKGQIITNEEFPEGIPKYAQQDGIWGYYNPSTNKYRRIE